MPLPLTALTHAIVMEGIGLGYGDEDFAALLVKQAAASGREVQPENVDFDDGLS